MFGNSKAVESNQPGLHEALEAVVRRHLHTAWRAPVAAHTRAAFDQATAWRQPERPLVLDSGCGTGRSSLLLAERYPQAQVIGLDQSAHRLARAGEAPANLLFLRAECADFWRLAAAAGWRLQQHYLLYPNPWPKARHLKRRWHAHPVFPALLQLGGALTLRSNWLLYLQEMAAALAVAGVDAGEPAPLSAAALASPLTDFEHKYRDSGHGLWELCVAMPREFSDAFNNHVC